MTGPVVAGGFCDALLELRQERYGGPPFGGYYSHAIYATNLQIRYLQVCLRGERGGYIDARPCRLPFLASHAIASFPEFLVLNETGTWRRPRLVQQLLSR